MGGFRPTPFFGENKMTSTSSRKLINAIKLYTSKVADPIEKIERFGDCYFIINEKHTVNISTNKVDKYYPDPEY